MRSNLVYQTLNILFSVVRIRCTQKNMKANVSLGTIYSQTYRQQHLENS